MLEGADAIYKLQVIVTVLSTIVIRELSTVFFPNLRMKEHFSCPKKSLCFKIKDTFPVILATAIITECLDVYILNAIYLFHLPFP